MIKWPKTRTLIETNKTVISDMLSGSDTHKRLNNVNWLRHELSYTEPRTLFHLQTKKQEPYLDYNSMKNLGEAYDYIIENQHKIIDENEIRKIHDILCTNTHICGGTLRTTDKILDIAINGSRYHAPDAYNLPTHMNEIVFEMNNGDTDVLTQAFELHYALIMSQMFDDFNKRNARLIMNWRLIQGGYRPIVFNKASDKQKYREAIAAYANGNRKEYMTYMYSVMLRTQNKIIKLLNKSRVL